jgi:hypothetical protein
MPRVLVGPDLDGDGFRELFVASHGIASDDPSRETRLLVHAVSGRDGSMLWTWAGPPAMRHWYSPIGPLGWWGLGADGWPRLMVPTVRGTILVSAKDGRMAEDLQDLWDPRIADLDGDGAPDLVATSGNQLVSVRGGRAEVWRRFGFWQAAQDFDGDGTIDLLPWTPGRNVSLEKTWMVSAVSGRDGRILWQSGLEAKQIPAEPYALGDFDGDGTADVLALLPKDGRWPGPVVAVSGRSGRRLWTARGFPTRPDEGKNDHGVDLQCLPDCDGDGRPDVALGYDLDGRLGKDRTVVLSGRTGHLIEGSSRPGQRLPYISASREPIPINGPGDLPRFVETTLYSRVTYTVCYVVPPGTPAVRETTPASKAPQGDPTRRDKGAK